VNELADRLDITAVLNRYAIAIDARDWDLFRTVFTEDVVADYGAHGRWDGIDHFVEVWEPIHRRWVSTQHIITNHHIELDGDRARTRSYVNALLVAAGTPGGDSATIRGYYDDELVRQADGWRIQHRRFHPFWYEGNLVIVGYQPGDSPRYEPPWSLASTTP
jgi:ketosteroid isomerase-like protein